MFKSRKGPQLPQQLIGGVRIGVEDDLLQRAAKEQLQGAWAKDHFTGHVVEQKLGQLRGQTCHAAAVLHAGS